MNIAEVYNASPTLDSASSQRASSTSNTNNDFDSYLNASTTTMDDIFQKASDTYGVPVNLLKAMAKQESNFNPNATSSCGAQGVMQLMPATAASLGVTDAYDPEQNIMGGAKYISQLLDKYNGDVSLALAAYNAGSGNVAKYGGIPPFKETQNYVAKVTAYMNETLTIENNTVSNETKQISSEDFLEACEQGMEMVQEDTRLQDILDQIFSYEDYLKFLKMYVDQLIAVKNSVTGYDTENQAADSADSIYSYQNIRYNPTVMNLLTGK